jgi:hypothetical protein
VADTPRDLQEAVSLNPDPETQSLYHFLEGLGLAGYKGIRLANNGDDIRTR